MALVMLFIVVRPLFIVSVKLYMVSSNRRTRAWFNRFSSVVLAYGFRHSTSDHSVFVQHSYAGIVVLIVYVVDIIISGDKSIGITALKHYLRSSKSCCES